MRITDVRSADDLSRFYAQCYARVHSDSSEDADEPGASVDSANSGTKGNGSMSAEEQREENARERERREYARRELAAFERELEEGKLRDWDSEP